MKDATTWLVDADISFVIYVDKFGLVRDISVHQKDSQ